MKYQEALDEIEKKKKIIESAKDDIKRLQKEAKAAEKAEREERLIRKTKFIESFDKGRKLTFNEFKLKYFYLLNLESVIKDLTEAEDFEIVKKEATQRAHNDFEHFQASEKGIIRGAESTQHNLRETRQRQSEPISKKERPESIERPTGPRAPLSASTNPVVNGNRKDAASGNRNSQTTNADEAKTPVLGDVASEIEKRVNAQNKGKKPNTILGPVTEKIAKQKAEKHADIADEDKHGNQILPTVSGMYAEKERQQEKSSTSSMFISKNENRHMRRPRRNNNLLAPPTADPSDEQSLVQETSGQTSENDDEDCE